MKKLLSFLSICALTLSALVFTACGAKSEPTSVMTMQVNPTVQFILDQNNKVINVTGVNEDGQNLILAVNFKGKTAEEAAKLFVEVSTQLGKIDVNSTGTTVDISLSSSDEANQKFENLKNSVKNSVNNFFKENGIIAGAKVHVQEIQEAINIYGEQVKTFVGETYEDAVEYLTEVSKEFENIDYSLRENLKTAINNIDAMYKTSVETAKQTIADLEDRLNKSEILPESIKKELKNQLNEAKTKFNEISKEIRTKIDAEVDTFEENSKQIIANLKTEINNIINVGKTSIENHKNAFMQDKEAIEKLINDYQEKLINA